MRSVDSLSDRQYMDEARAIGCIACLASGNEGTPASLHHPRADVGMSEKALDTDVIPLCPMHHLGYGADLNFPSVHMNPELFTHLYGDEHFLTKLTRTIIQQNLNRQIGCQRA